MGKIITFASYRCGVGRSTFIGLAGMLLSQNHRVLLIDASFGDLTKIMIPDEAQIKGSLMQGIATNSFDLSIYQINDTLSIIPYELSTHKEANLYDLEISNLELFSTICTPLKKSYDYILIDTPSHAGALLISSIIASDSCFQITDLFGIEDSEDRIDHFHELFKEIQQTYPNATLSGIILSIIGYRENIISKRLPILKNRYPDLVFQNCIEQIDPSKLKNALNNKHDKDLTLYRKITEEIISRLNSQNGVGADPAPGACV